MARTVREIMNPQLLSIHPTAPTKETLDLILDFGITAVPVLDPDGRPIGVSSLRDLVHVGVVGAVDADEAAPITKPATTVALNALVASVAETMATTGRHHLVVVDADGKAVGMVSTLDVIRALIGHPVKHPSTFLHRDPDYGVSWSSDEVLDESTVTAALPTQPGVMLLLRGGVDRSDEELVWAEATMDLRARANAFCSARRSNSRSNTTESIASAVDDVKLERILEQEEEGNLRLRVRYAIVHDSSARLALAIRLKDRIAHAPPPGGT